MANWNRICNICKESIDGLENLARYRGLRPYLFFHIACIAKDDNYNSFVEQGRSVKIVGDETGPLEIRVAKPKNQNSTCKFIPAEQK